MDLSKKLTATLCNYNGFRTCVGKKRRIEITLNSLLDCFPKLNDMRFLLIDNQSCDGSEQFIKDFKIGKKMILPRLFEGQGWFYTSRNNVANFKRILETIETPYFWNIENDSYFYNSHPFVEKSIEALEKNQDISIVHLRRWTPLDCKDKPGAPQNHCRVEKIRTSSPSKIYVLEKSKEENIWVDVGEGLPENFKPYTNEDDFKSLRMGESPGCIRKKSDGGWQRLIEDHYNTYSNHGFIVRTADLKFIIKKYSPPTEKEISIYFKKHFKATKIEEDAFISFGWNTRIKPSEREISDMFKWAREHNYSSIVDYGTIKGIKINT